MYQPHYYVTVMHCYVTVMCQPSSIIITSIKYHPIAPVMRTCNTVWVFVKSGPKSFTITPHVVFLRAAGLFPSRKVSRNGRGPTTGGVFSNTALIASNSIYSTQTTRAVGCARIVVANAGARQKINHVQLVFKGG